MLCDYFKNTIGSNNSNSENNNNMELNHLFTSKHYCIELFVSNVIWGCNNDFIIFHLRWNSVGKCFSVKKPICNYLSLSYSIIHKLIIKWNNPNSITRKHGRIHLLLCINFLLHDQLIQHNIQYHLCCIMVYILFSGKFVCRRFLNILKISKHLWKFDEIC